MLEGGENETGRSLWGEKPAGGGGPGPLQIAECLEREASAVLQLAAEVAGALRRYRAEGRRAETGARQIAIKAIGGVVGFHAQFELHLLGDDEVLGQREVDVLEAHRLHAVILQRIGAAGEGGQALDLNLVRPVPVYFAYITAWADPSNGRVEFRPDIYGRDGAAARGAVGRDPNDAPPAASASALAP